MLHSEEKHLSSILKFLPLRMFWSTFLYFAIEGYEGSWRYTQRKNKKKMQYANLRNLTDIFNHWTELAKSLMKVFSPFACIATIYGKNGNNNTELFRTSPSDTAEICFYMIVAMMLIWLSQIQLIFNYLVYYSLQLMSSCSPLHLLHTNKSIHNRPGTITTSLTLTSVFFVQLLCRSHCRSRK